MSSNDTLQRTMIVMAECFARHAKFICSPRHSVAIVISGDNRGVAHGLKICLGHELMRLALLDVHKFKMGSSKKRLLDHVLT